MSDFLPPGRPAPTPLRLVPWGAHDASIALDLHMHTTHTDGKASIAEMVAAAVEAGIAEILFSEHVRHTSTYFPEFASEVRAVNKPGVHAYLGAEAKILDLDGALDCPPSAAAICDGLIGSVHSLPENADGTPQKWSQLDAATAVEREFAFAMAIVTKSRAHILGHPMGMCVSRFRLAPLEQIGQLARACREHGKAFELNVRYCPQPAEWIDAVQRAGCLVSIGSDAHSTREVGGAWAAFMKEGTTTG